MAGKLNLKINQGETFRHGIFWKDAEEVAINITGFTARMHIRERLESATTLMELTTENGRIVIVNAVEGEIRLYITAADSTLISWAAGVYDLEMVSPSGEVTRLIEGKVTVSKEVTR